MPGDVFSKCRELKCGHLITAIARRKKDGKTFRHYDKNPCDDQKRCPIILQHRENLKVVGKPDPWEGIKVWKNTL